MKGKIEFSICLYLIIINGLQALSYYKFDIDTDQMNRTNDVAVAMEKKSDDYHALKGE